MPRSDLQSCVFILDFCFIAFDPNYLNLHSFMSETIWQEHFSDSSRVSQNPELSGSQPPPRVLPCGLGFQKENDLFEEMRR